MVTPRIRHELRHRRRRLHLPFGAQKFLSVLEGIEGGFAISAGVVAGLSFAEITDQRILLITAGVSILVNGFNASAVKYSSEHYEDELDGREKHDPWRAYFVPAAIEFVIYFAVCLLTLLPLLVFSSTFIAVGWCTLLTALVLFAAGIWRGFLLKLHPIRDGIELTLLGLLIIAIGASAGYILSY
ncbi:MAG TPA: VIT1/CCC1 transporter family protein [Candidatus Saccharimonadales bacterium]